MDLLICCGGCLMFVGWVAFLVGVIVDCLCCLLVRGSLLCGLSLVGVWGLWHLRAFGCVVGCCLCLGIGLFVY